MKKQIVALLTLAFVLMASIGIGTTVSAAENVTTARRFNVVFVVDASNSMNFTDSQGWRFEAIDQFLSLLSLKGNHVGTVVFNGEILVADGVSAVNSKNDKQTASNAVKKATPTGYTNIGEALAKANELLKNGDAALPSIILLLSDGNTEMPSGADLQRSIEAREVAITDAKNNGTKIYCVGLNANGRVDASELTHIAEQTNGISQVVTKADDLKDVFKEFYKLIYGTGGTEIQNVALPAVKEFVVPKIGVEEVNILIDGQPTAIKLTQPSGIEVEMDVLNEMITKGNHFTNIKMENPLSGTWKLKLEGDPSQTVTINFIPNLNVALVMDVEQKDVYKRGDTISIVTQIASNGAIITDNSVYQEYPAIYTITKADDTSSVQTIQTVALEGRYKGEATFTEVGTYYITASIDIGYGKITGNTQSINVENISPKPVESVVSINEYAIKFGEKQFLYDLNEMIIDEDGEVLTYMIDKSSFDTDEYVAQDGVLTVIPKEEKEGTFSIIATDALGASCEMEISIVYKNLLLYILIAVGMIVALAAGGIFMAKRIKVTKPFNGSVTVVAYDNDAGESSAPMTEWPARKPIDINSINYNADAIGGIKGYFYGSGKEYVNFKVKGVAYQNCKKVKIVKIYDGCTDKITSREDGDKGVEITFMSQNRGY